MINEKVDVLVIGAGLSGLIFAAIAQSAGKKVLILEKSKGLGGRLATRRIDDIGVDHGVQWFQDYPQIKHTLDQWAQKGWIIKSEKGFYAPQGMTSLAKKLAEGLTIHKAQRASKILKEESWKVETEEESTYYASTVVVTAPLPQTCELLNPTLLLPFSLSDILKEYQYNKTLIGIFTVEEIPQEITSFENNGDHFIVMREKSLHPKVILFALNPERTKQIYANSDFECLSIIESEFKKITENKLKITHLELKRWRYSTPEKAIASTFIEPKNNLFLIGDSFLYPDIRGAILSAQELGKHLYKI